MITEVRPTPARSIRAEPEQIPVLVGAERSGTTLLRLMLNHHPSLSWINEFEYAVDFVGDDGALPNVDDFARRMETQRVFRASGFTIDRGLRYLELVRSFVQQRRERSGRALVGLTVHRHFDRVLRLWPQARFIHLIRDGRDVARSCVEMGWAGHVHHGVERWIEAERLWERVQAGLPSQRWIELTYEDLIREPEVQLARLCDFLGVAYSPAMLSYPSDTTYAPPNPKLVFQWRRKLSPRNLALLEGRIGAMLTQRSYELSGAPPATPGWFERAGLSLRNRWGRMRFRQRRYGLGLWLASLLAQRLPLPGWRRSLRLKLNELDAKHLK